MYCADLEELEKEAARLVLSLSPTEKGATIIGLSGELGAGKTAFVKGAARALGVGEIVTSPTFVIEKIYKLDGRAFENLIHIDAYRLEREEELRALGFEEIVRNPRNLIFVEWPERVSGLLPPRARILTFSLLPDERRRITLTFHGKEN